MNKKSINFIQTENIAKQEQQELEKKALDQLLSGESLFGKDGWCLFTNTKEFYRKSTSSRDEFSFKCFRKQ